MDSGGSKESEQDLTSGDRPSHSPALVLESPLVVRDEADKTPAEAAAVVAAMEAVATLAEEEETGAQEQARKDVAAAEEKGATVQERAEKDVVTAEERVEKEVSAEEEAEAAKEKADLVAKEVEENAFAAAEKERLPDRVAVVKERVERSPVLRSVASVAEAKEYNFEVGEMVLVVAPQNNSDEVRGACWWLSVTGASFTGRVCGGRVCGRVCVSDCGRGCCVILPTSPRLSCAGRRRV